MADPGDTTVPANPQEPTPDAPGRPRRAVVLVGIAVVVAIPLVFLLLGRAHVWVTATTARALAADALTAQGWGFVVGLLPALVLWALTGWALLRRRIGGWGCLTAVAVVLVVALSGFNLIPAARGVRADQRQPVPSRTLADHVADVAPGPWAEQLADGMTWAGYAILVSLVVCLGCLVGLSGDRRVRRVAAVVTLVGALPAAWVALAVVLFTRLPPHLGGG